MFLFVHNIATGDNSCNPGFTRKRCRDEEATRIPIAYDRFSMTIALVQSRWDSQDRKESSLYGRLPNSKFRTTCYWNIPSVPQAQ